MIGPSIDPRLWYGTERYYSPCRPSHGSAESTINTAFQRGSWIIPLARLGSLGRDGRRDGVLYIRIITHRLTSSPSAPQAMSQLDSPAQHAATAGSGILNVIVGHSQAMGDTSCLSPSRGRHTLASTSYHGCQPVQWHHGVSVPPPVQ